jgi:uncharacterized protein YjbI with pentapeptide repeats
LSEEPGSAGPAPDGWHRALRADCERCFGLCCVAPAFSASADFAIDKPAGHPCPHLQADFRCGIHTGLRERGFRGCAVYDCFGAGQQVSQVTFGGRDWRQDPLAATQMYAVFPVMRQLHELLWHLAAALALPPARADLRGASLRGARLIGADLRHADLRLADLTGADLRGTDLGGADLTTSLFLTQAQLDAAEGDTGTGVPASLTRPAHWPLSGGSS